MFKELPERIDILSIRNIRDKRRPIEPYHHKEIIYELGHHEPKLALQILLTPIRNDMPWVYDNALECLNAIQKAKTMSGAERILRKFMDTVEISFSHPILRDYNEMYRYTKDYPNLIYECLMFSMERKASKIEK